MMATNQTVVPLAFFQLVPFHQIGMSRVVSKYCAPIDVYKRQPPSGVASGGGDTMAMGVRHAQRTRATPIAESLRSLPIRPIQQRFGG